jgi:hypothetical protein
MQTLYLWDVENFFRTQSSLISISWHSILLISLIGTCSAEKSTCDEHALHVSRTRQFITVDRVLFLDRSQAEQH